MERTPGDQKNSAKWFIHLSPIPERLRPLSSEHNWKTIRDVIRGLAYIPEKKFQVFVGNCEGHWFANCDFKEERDARDVFSRIQGHQLENVVLQAWLFQPGQHGHKLLYGPKDEVTRAELWPPVYRPRGSRGQFSPQSNQTGPPTHDMVVNRTGRNPNVSQDRVLIQPLPAASIATHDSFNNFGAVLSPYATNLNSYQQHLGHLSPSLGDISELSDSSRALFNTPELSSSSRNSSVSAIPDAYLPAGNSSHGAFHSIPGSPYPNHNSSISSKSNPHTPADSRNQSGSSHTLQDTTNETYKVIIRNVKPGVTHEQLSKLLDQYLSRYVQYERPKQGEGNKWSVKFFKEEDAEKARERLNGVLFNGNKLKVPNGGPRRQMGSDISTIRASSPSTGQGPIIV